MSFIDSFRNAPPRRQAAFAAAAAAGICALLFTAYFLFLHKSYEVLFSDLRDMDAATIVAELEEQKVPYRLRDGGRTILAPEDMVDATRLHIMGSDLPIKGAVGFELFNKSDMGLTEFAQKINYQRALQGELARTIMTMEGVEAARVHLAITEQTVFRDDRAPPKASVTILTRPGQSLSVGAVQGIQRLVAAAVPELKVANVVVLDDRGEVLSGEPASEAAATPAMQERLAVESYYAARVRMALTAAYPGQSMEVSVAAPFMPTGASLSPQTRSYALRVSVTPSAPLGADDRENVRRLTQEAIGGDAALGDVVTVDERDWAMSEPSASPADAPLPEAADAPRPGTSRLSLVNWALALALPGLLLLLVAAFMVNRRGGLRTLTPAQREDYTRRLKQLLDGGDADVAPPA